LETTFTQEDIMAVAPFYLGTRAGATPIMGTTLRAHYIDEGEMGSVCGHAAPNGWGPVSPGGTSVTDLGLVTCGACLAALTWWNNVPANAV
jgi:hypothetical protein